MFFCVLAQGLKSLLMVGVVPSGLFPSVKNCANLADIWVNNSYLINLLLFGNRKILLPFPVEGVFSRRIRRICRTMIPHAECAEYAEAYRTKLCRIAIHKILRFLRAIHHSTTILRVMPFIFTKYRPCSNSMVSLPSISLVKMVCPRVLVTVNVPVPSMVTRSLAGLG